MPGEPGDTELARPGRTVTACTSGTEEDEKAGPYEIAPTVRFVTGN